MKLRSLELLRGLAALAVVLHHATLAFKEVPALGYGGYHGGFIFPGIPGVEFFFVLSGFVMVIAHGGEAGRFLGIARFAWRRICRIYPLYWLVMAILFFQVSALPWFTPARVVDWLALMPAYHRQLEPFTNLLAVAWTLRLEIGFYLLFAMVMLPAIGPLILGAWIAGTIIQTWFGAPLPPLVADLLNPFGVEFLCGMAAGYAFRRLRADWRAAAYLLAAAIPLLAGYWHGSHGGLDYGTPDTRLAAGAGFAALILGLAWFEATGLLCLGAWAAAAGELSYPLYISHLLTVTAISRYAPALLHPSPAAQLVPNAMMAIEVAAALSLAALLTWGFDRPARRLLRGQHLWRHSAKTV